MAKRKVHYFTCSFGAGEVFGPFYTDKALGRAMNGHIGAGDDEDQPDFCTYGVDTFEHDSGTFTIETTKLIPALRA